MAVKEKPGAQPEVAQVAADVLRADDRLAQGVKQVVALSH
jgi:hypothetical protein